MDVESWHPEAISPSVEAVYRNLLTRSLVHGFYLAGGTGLALQLGHRRSFDLDFFHPELFQEGELMARMQGMGGFSILATSPHTIHALFGGVRISLLGYPFPLLFPTKMLHGGQIADARDIACMKLSAIAGLGSKRDFVDVYVAAQRFGLEELIAMFEQKYAGVRFNKVHLAKSLAYFTDAERDPMPDMLYPLDWDRVKHFFLLCSL